MVPSEALHGASQACCRMARCRRGFPSAPAQARVRALPLDPGTALCEKKAAGGTWPGMAAPPEERRYVGGVFP